MKSLLIALSVLFIWQNSNAQLTDTSQIVVRRGPRIYYIDGIRVQSSCDSIKDSIITEEEIRIITGGLPVVYGDAEGSVIQISPISPAETNRKRMKKQQKMVTE